MGKSMFAVSMPQMGDAVVGFCDNCGQDTNFIYIGDQKYPAKVAEKLGITPSVQVWRCEQCHTTVSVSQAEPIP